MLQKPSADFNVYALVVLVPRLYTSTRKLSTTEGRVHDPMIQK